MVWQGDMSLSEALLLGFGQLDCDTTAMVLKADSLISYHVFAVLLNFSPRLSSWLINNNHSIIGFQLNWNVKSQEHS